MRGLLTILLLSAASPASAVLLRSGEHGDYTRLAYSQAGLVSWTIEQIERRVEIRFSPVPDLDLSQAFARIGRDRIRNVEVRDDVLVLDLSCNCVAEITRVEPDQVAIDVRAGTAPPSSENPAPDTALPMARLVERGVVNEPRLPLVLEPITARLAPAVTRADQEDLVGTRRGTGAEASEVSSAPQLEIRDGRAVSTRMENPNPLRPLADPTTCVGYERLRRILLGDPDTALASLPSLIENYDPDKKSSARALIEAYATIGLMTEARYLSEATDVAQPATALLYAASDEVRIETPVNVDPACNAEAALLAMASGGEVETLPTVLQQEILVFVQSLPEHHRKGLLHRAVDSARASGLIEFAAELASWTLDNQETNPTQALPEYATQLAAGLQAQIEKPDDVQEVLNESLSLVREISDRETTQTIYRTALRAAAARGDLAESLAALEKLDEASRADSLGQVAQDILDNPNERAIVLATLLFPLGAEMPVKDRERVAGLLRRSGYSSLAGRWAFQTPDRIEDPGAEPQQLQRTPQATSQAELLGTVRRRTNELPPIDTFEGAAVRLSQSREIAARVAAILERRPGSTDP